MGKNPHLAIILVSAVSANLAGGTLLGIFLGIEADKLLSTKPIFTIIGLLVGLAAGIYGMILTVNKFTEREKSRE
ncbi:AtpZ/AtpI family protein [Ornithinibacillus sp. BX22]|uniref:AtpZ/AtpI family protein n=2 Tax=Ornithinibacillus TaxID=484508 RepID=A0A923L363_9BACI|nr:MULTISPECIES: AtpZ/AtpI family protein [Ornithinibacillus]MBC5635634.1 AtpZ/AtpI family protein [Ornithinibacillus hominis]MBS3679245.1 AtpZ/AtpI family protein [Ornithinibacillus massiliensis]